MGAVAQRSSIFEGKEFQSQNIGLVSKSHTQEWESKYKMLILEPGKAKVSLESEGADNMVSLIDSDTILDEIIDACGLCLGWGE